MRAREWAEAKAARQPGLTPYVIGAVIDFGNCLDLTTRDNVELLRDAPMQWTGVGSLMTAHFQRGAIRRPVDLCSDPGLRELFHLDMLERGFHLVRRGMVALSLVVGQAETDAFTAAVDEFLDTRAPLLAG